MSRWRYTDYCPVCRAGMFTGDIVCRACVARVEAQNPGIFRVYANRNLSDVGMGFELRAKITAAASDLLPKKRKPQEVLQP